MDVDEEIFIDYGDEWESAWREHVASWSSPPNSEAYHPNYELNSMEDVVIPTVAEDSYFSEFHELRCHEIFRPWWGLNAFESDSYPCRATDRYEKNGETVYNVEILLRVHNQDETRSVCEEEVDEVMFGVPLDIFVLQDKTYTRDQLQPWSFRHDMRIPDELMPRAWIANCSSNSSQVPATELDSKSRPACESGPESQSC
jgi:hypothetical protein